MTRKLTLPQARKMVGDILRNSPETRFQRLTGAGCQYFHPVTGAPCCIVGHVLHRIGFELEDLGSWDNTTILKALFEDEPDSKIRNRITKPAYEFLWEAQKMQDSGRSWGEIYEELYGDGETNVS